MREIVWSFWIGHTEVSWYKELLKDEKFFEIEVTSEYFFLRIYKLYFLKFYGQDTCTFRTWK